MCVCVCVCVCPETFHRVQMSMVCPAEFLRTNASLPSRHGQRIRGPSGYQHLVWLVTVELLKGTFAVYISDEVSN